MHFCVSVLEELALLIQEARIPYSVDDVCYLSEIDLRCLTKSPSPCEVILRLHQKLQME